MPEQEQAGGPEKRKRQLPALEVQSAFFWTSGSTGALQIARCTACEHYVHPPLPRCLKCQSVTAPHAVSGLGKVKTFTVNIQQWAPGMEVPFVFAAVELAEQRELYVLTNIVDCEVAAVYSDMDVEVKFEQQEDVYLPMFRPREVANAG